MTKVETRLFRRQPTTRGVIGITLGDPAGIGPEIVEAALDSGKLDRRFSYRVIGSASKARLGSPTKSGAKAARAALETAASLCLTRKIDAIVTGPIHKSRMREIGFDYPGHTEFFAERFQTENFAMLLTGGKLTVALVTTHIPLRDAIASLRPAEIVRVGGLLADFLIRRGKISPRIAVAGLNPHAGESGTMGREEIEIVAPAIERLQSSKTATFSGPHSPDTVFNRAIAGEFDAVLCLYHDQGLIPLKLHAFDRGVNVTLGLPFVRTSPDHGTAFEIAGQGLARPNSMIAAINLACELVAKSG